MIIDHIRNLEEFRSLFEARPMPQSYEFKFLINNPNLFCFYDKKDGKLKGFITIQKEGGKLTLSGVSRPKIMPDVIVAIKKICEQFNEDMYSFTPLKEAGLVLKKAGFQKIYTDKNGITCYCRFSKTIPETERRKHGKIKCAKLFNHHSKQ